MFLLREFKGQFVAPEIVDQGLPVILPVVPGSAYLSTSVLCLKVQIVAQLFYGAMADPSGGRSHSCASMHLRKDKCVLDCTQTALEVPSYEQPSNPHRQNR